MPHNQIIILERVGIPLAVQIIAYRKLFIRVAGNNTPSTCVEPKNIVDEPPHVRVNQPVRLTEDGHQVMASPLKQSTITRDAEGHLSGKDLDGVQFEKFDEIWVRAWVKNDL